MLEKLKNFFLSAIRIIGTVLASFFAFWFISKQGRSGGDTTDTGRAFKEQRTDVEGQRTIIAGQREAAEQQSEIIAGQRETATEQSELIRNQRSLIEKQREHIEKQREGVNRIREILTKAEVDNGR